MPSGISFEVSADASAGASAPEEPTADSSGEEAAGGAAGGAAVEAGSAAGEVVESAVLRALVLFGMAQVVLSVVRVLAPRVVVVVREWTGWRLGGRTERSTTIERAVTASSSPGRLLTVRAQPLRGSAVSRSTVQRRLHSGPGMHESMSDSLALKITRKLSSMTRSP